MSVNLLPSEAIGTIDHLIDYFDKLFDILNSSNVTSTKKYEKIFIENELQFLEEMIYFLKCIKVIDNNGTYVK